MTAMSLDLTGSIVVPTWMVVSQWVLLIGLSILVFLVYRQLGFVFQLKDMRSERGGLPTGESAPGFEYQSVHNGESLQFNPHGQWSLLVFADPGCSSCHGTLQTLEKVAPTLAQTFQILVVTTAEPRVIEAVDAFRMANVEIGRVTSSIPDKLYQTHVTPFAYTIDPAGIVADRGIPGDERAIKKLTSRASRSLTRQLPIVS
jgi:hypothetical protein